MRIRRMLGAVAALACVALLSACSLLPHIPSPGYDDDGQKDDVVLQHIADAVKHHDVAALKTLFSRGARAEASDLDAGLKYFLSFFPSGRMTWEVGGAGPGGTGGTTDGYSWESFADYKVFADGKTYELYFANVTTYTARPDFVGIYALGIVPYSTNPYTASGAPKAFNLWASQFDLNDENVLTGMPSVYVPGAPHSIISDIGLTPDVEMQDIAAAVKNQDPEALAKLFSTRAKQKATDLPGGLKYFLSAFPPGQITWKSMTPTHCYERGGYATAAVANCSSYKVTASGKEYDLFFADFVVDQPDPDSIGIYALGIAPYTATTGAAATPSMQFTAWAKSHKPYPDGKISGPVGVYVPQS